jgi:hypothetical protein
MITLVDAGPLVTLFDRAQSVSHQQCVAAQQKLFVPLWTSWACFTEALHLLGRMRGWFGQQALWRFYLENDGITIYTLNESEIRRMYELMEKYHDVPMDLADASLVAMAETTGLRQIFTLDSDFYIYLINDTDPFEVVPLT